MVNFGVYGFEFEVFRVGFRVEGLRDLDFGCYIGYWDDNGT